MTTDPGDALVPVHVPRRHLTAVYGFLASLDAPSPPADGAETEPGEAFWPVEDLRRFAGTPTTTSDTIGKVLDTLATEPGEYFSTSRLEQLTGVPRSNLKGAFAALTRHLKAHYGARGWMLEFEWGPRLSPDHPAEGHYRISPEQAARWREARAS